MSNNDSEDKTRTYFQLQKDIIIGHYRIIEKIGAGGMGEVYLAEDTELNRKVALKFLPTHLCQDVDCRARFKREAQAAAKLDHPNIVSVFEVGEFQGRPFFSMQVVEGPSLKEVIAGKTLPLGRIIEIGIQICGGLQAAQEKGITHRDIKPSNILIDSHSRARIVDFGLASILGTDQLTKTGTTLGTVGYMSPEQVRGEELDARSDIFSLGVVLYEMIARRSPFAGDHELAISYAIQYEEPEPLARYKSGVSAELQRIVSKALAKDKALRYQHADELAADLRLLVGASGSAAARSTRKRRVIALSFALLGLLVLGFVLKPWRLVTGPPSVTGHRIVVVPFRNQTGDTALYPLGVMAADWTTQSLLGTGLVEVVSPEALLQLNTTKGIRSVVSATGADMIVTGSYYKIGDSLQFQANISTADEKLLQSIEPIYARTAKAMDAIDGVRQRVVGALAILLEERLEGLSATNMKPPTYEAYQEYMQGFDDFARLYDWAASLEHFSRAYYLDTTFLMPLLFAAGAYENSGRVSESDSVLEFLSARKSRLTPLHRLHLEYMQASHKGDFPGALVVARRGAALAPGSLFEWEVGVTALILNRPRESINAFKRWNFDAGFARTWQGNWIDFQQAHHLIGEHEKELEIARQGRERFPTSFDVLNSEIVALAALGRIDDINRLIEESLTWPAQPGVNPAGPIKIAADELRAHGHEAEAMALLERAIGWYRSRPADELRNLSFAYALALYTARKFEEAKAIYEEIAKYYPNNTTVQTFRGLIAARQGDRETAIKVSDWLRDVKTPYQFGTNTYNRACIASTLGEKEQAVALLKESLRQGFPFSIGIHRDIDFESLRDYPPFIELLKPKG